MESINTTKKQLKGLAEQANNLIKSGDVKDKAEGQGMLTAICFMLHKLQVIEAEYNSEVNRHNRCYI